MNLIERIDLALRGLGDADSLLLGIQGAGSVMAIHRSIVQHLLEARRLAEAQAAQLTEPRP